MKSLPLMRRVLRGTKWLIVPLISTTLIYGLLFAATAVYFGVRLHPSGIVSGYLLELLLGYLLYAVSRQTWAFILLQATIMGALLVGNAVMIGFFSVPIRPADFSALPTLVDQLSGWRLLLVVLPLAAIVLLFVFNFRYRRLSAVPVIVGLALLWALPVTVPAWLSHKMDDFYGYSAWALEENYVDRGPILYLINEYARDRAHARHAPSRRQVATLLRRKNIKTLPGKIAIARPRNVYIIFMESFWDASLLKSAHFNRDPLSPEFRKLWHGDSWAMVPVFGHGSANSEFEALCGIPVLDGQIVFVSKIVQRLPCLPRLLAQAGYRTAAYTPDDAGVWDHLSAYRNLGFERFYAKRSFAMIDRNGVFLSDSSLFSQVAEYIRQDTPPGHPTLTYIETTSGHYPYYLSRSRAPIIGSRSNNPLVAKYANDTFYDSRELAAYIGKIRATDPSAIIVAFGDHLPAFGTDVSDYVASGLFPAQMDQFTPSDMLAHQSTPLLVINGKAGALQLGHVPLYQLPAIVLRLLGVQRSIPGTLFAPPAGLRVRPAEQRLLVLGADGDPVFCATAATRECKKAENWLNDARLLSADILDGKQYAVLQTTGRPTPPNVDTGRPYLAAGKVGSCDIKIVHWGPRAIPIGGPGKGQAHAIWIRYSGHLGRAQIWLGSARLDMHFGKNHLIAGSLPSKAMLSVARTLPVTLQCNNDPKIRKIGSFRIGDNDKN